MSSTDRDPGGRAGGFTLIEVMIALVISGLLATVIFQLVQGQGRFASMQGARAEVQQNSRGALELIGSEIRSLPSSAIEFAGASQIRYRLPRAWGILCNVPPASGGTVGVVFPPGTFPGEFPTNFSQPNGWGLAVPGTATGSFVAASITSSTAASGACPTALGVAAGSGAVMRQFTLSALPAGTSMEVGKEVFVFQRIEYDVDLSSSGGPRGYWVRRRTAAGNPEPLAGPLLTIGSQTEGLQFTYLCGSQVLTPAQLGVPGNLAAIDRIRVRVAMQSRSLARNSFDASTGQQKQTDSMTVSLRNRKEGVACP